MPKSKQRKGHKRRSQIRNLEIKNNKARIKNLYDAMYKELDSKHLNVPAMLNAEDEADLEIPTTAVWSQWTEPTEEEKKVINSAVLTITP